MPGTVQRSGTGTARLAGLAETRDHLCPAPGFEVIVSFAALLVREQRPTEVSSLAAGNFKTEGL